MFSVWCHVTASVDGRSHCSTANRCDAFLRSCLKAVGECPSKTVRSGLCGADIEYTLPPPAARRNTAARSAVLFTQCSDCTDLTATSCFVSVPPASFAYKKHRPAERAVNGRLAELSATATPQSGPLALASAGRRAVVCHD